MANHDVCAPAACNLTPAFGGATPPALHGATPASVRLLLSVLVLLSLPLSTTPLSPHIVLPDGPVQPGPRHLQSNVPARGYFLQLASSSAWFPGSDELVVVNLQTALSGSPGLQHACTIAVLTSCETDGGDATTTPLPEDDGAAVDDSVTAVSPSPSSSADPVVVDPSPLPDDTPPDIAPPCDATDPNATCPDPLPPSPTPSSTQTPSSTPTPSSTTSPTPTGTPTPSRTPSSSPATILASRQAARCSITPIALLRVAGPVLTFPSPNVLGGGTLEVSCRATDSAGNDQTAELHVPSRGDALCTCASVQANGGSRNITRTIVSGPLPTLGREAVFNLAVPTAAVVVPDAQSLSRAGGETLTFTATTGLDGVPGVRYAWTVSYLLGCDNNNLVCGRSAQGTEIVSGGSGGGRSLAVSVPAFPAGATVLVVVVALPPGVGVGGAGTQTASVSIATVGQQVCLCLTQVATSPALLPLPPGSNPSATPSPNPPSAPALTRFPVISASGLTSWQPGHGVLTFFAPRNPFGLVTDASIGPFTYAWVVTALTRCGVRGDDTCTSTRLFSIDEGSRVSTRGRRERRHRRPVPKLTTALPLSPPLPPTPDPHLRRALLRRGRDSRGGRAGLLACHRPPRLGDRPPLHLRQPHLLCVRRHAVRRRPHPLLCRLHARHDGRRLLHHPDGAVRRLRLLRQVAHPLRAPAAPGRPHVVGVGAVDAGLCRRGRGRRRRPRRPRRGRRSLRHPQA
jgi:hypothetical protein